MLNSLQKLLPELPREIVRSCMSAVQGAGGLWRTSDERNLRGTPSVSVQRRQIDLDRHQSVNRQAGTRRFGCASEESLENHRLHGGFGTADYTDYADFFRVLLIGVDDSD